MLNSECSTAASALSSTVLWAKIYFVTPFLAAAKRNVYIVFIQKSLESPQWVKDETDNWKHKQFVSAPWRGLGPQFGS